MFDFNGYTLNELTAIDNFVCYTRAMAAEHIDLPQIRRELMQLHRLLSCAINTRLDEAAEEWDAAHKNTTAYKAAEVPAAKVQLSSIYGTCAAEPAGDPPALADPPAPPDLFGWVGDALDDLCAAGEVIGNDR